MKPHGVDAYPLAWPHGWQRTRVPQRSRFDATFAAARDGLFAQIKMLGGTHVVMSTNVPLRRDGIPYANMAQPTDRGVAIYFLRRGRQMVFACDRWTMVEHNMRAIEKTIDAIRGIERWGASEMMERAFSAFEALPAPGADHWYDVLGVSKTATRDQVEAAHREKAKRAHPDTGGSHDAMTALNKAKADALRAIGAN